MQVGIIAEGRSDQAVIANILKGKLGIDLALITFIQPEFYYDETDLHSGSYRQMSEAEFGGWVSVRICCIERSRIAEFLNATDENRIVIIQIDTAEASDRGFDIEKPDKKDKGYSKVLRDKVIDKINAWLNNHFLERLYYAVTIEEIEAWLLPILGEKVEETAKSSNPKNTLRKLINLKMPEKERKRHFQLSEYKQHLELSKEFQKPKLLEKHCRQNESLLLFCQSLEKVDTSEI